MGKYFGTDGIRGVANIELTAELAYKIGRCSAYILTKETKHIPKILVGTDTRISADMLSHALMAGICSVGAYAEFVGVLPTPGIAYLVRAKGYDAGVVISASHNPMEYNGIKIFNKNGYKLKDELENEIEEIMLNEEKYNKLPSPKGESIGTIKKSDGLLDTYIEFLKSTINVSLDGIKIAIDCANGASYITAPKTYSELGAEVYTINNKPNGININLNCGSTHIETLTDFVKDNHCHIGLAFDGDADRVIAIDENGEIVDGDYILAICGMHMKQKGTLKNNSVVTTVMSNLGFMIMAQKNNINVPAANVGDRYVLELMLNNDYNLGGEQSGHIIFLDHNPTGDGVLTGIQLLAIMKETGEKLSKLASIMEKLPQVLINANVSNSKKNDYITDEIINAEIKRIENIFNEEGRVLIRASGTEPLIRIMIEGRDKELIEKEAKTLAELIQQRL